MLLLFAFKSCRCAHFAAIPEDFNPVCDAFAHWVWAETGGDVMVTDVQGWYNKTGKKVVLTDPCVHSRTPGLLDDVRKDGGLVSPRGHVLHIYIYLPTPYFLFVYGWLWK